MHPRSGDEGRSRADGILVWILRADSSRCSDACRLISARSSWRGVHLSRFCHSRLEDAERRIEILNERGQLQDASSLLNESANTQSSKGKS